MMFTFLMQGSETGSVQRDGFQKSYNKGTQDLSVCMIFSCVITGLMH